MVLRYYATPRNSQHQAMNNERHPLTKWNSRWSSHHTLNERKGGNSLTNNDFPQQSVSVIRQIINNLSVSQTPASVRLTVNNQIGGSELRGFLKLTSNDQVEIITIHGTQMYPLSAIQSIQ